MKSALLSGSFDPPTLGHLDLILRASQLVDQLVVGVAENSTKKPLLGIKTRVSLLKKLLKSKKNITVLPIKGLTVAFAKKHNISLLIRGVRPQDLHFESELAFANRALSKLETLFLPASPEFQSISSTLIKEIAQNGGSLKAFVPKEVEAALKKL